MSFLHQTFFKFYHVTKIIILAGNNCLQNLQIEFFNPVYCPCFTGFFLENKLELTKIYKKSAKLILELTVIEEELKKIKCDSITELKAKKLILEGVGYGANALLLSIEIMDESIANKDDTLAMETFLEQYSDELVH